MVVYHKSRFKVRRKTGSKLGIWLMKVEGEKKGFEVSVPLYYPSYTDEMQNEIHSWEEGTVVTLTLISEEGTYNWRIDEIHNTYRPWL